MLLFPDLLKNLHQVLINKGRSKPLTVTKATVYKMNNAD